MFPFVEKQEDRDTQRKPPPGDLLPKCPQQAEMGQADARRPKLSLGLQRK